MSELIGSGFGLFPFDRNLLRTIRKSQNSLVADEDGKWQIFFQIFISSTIHSLSGKVFEHMKTVQELNERQEIQH